MYTITIALYVLFVATFSDAKTILWTAAGGNPLWNNAGNWDCGCLPTASDDVVIDIQAIAGNVQIGGIVAAAECNSLTIGGTSRFLQRLTVTGPLNIGPGGGVLNSNAQLYVESSPTAPIKNSGQFTSRGGVFAFETGALTGTGTFVFPVGTLLNFTGPAAKSISTLIKVSGNAVVTSPTGTALQLTSGGQLVIDGTFKSPSNLIVTSDKASFFSVVSNGLFYFSGQTLSIQGNASFTNWALGAGAAATIINTINSDSLSIADGASLTLIGSVTDKRLFTKVTGSGAILSQGGSNVFNAFQASSVSATGGDLYITTGTVNSFQLGGSSLTGGTINAGSVVLSSGTIGSGLALNAGSMTISGVVNINNDYTSVSVSKQLTISSSSQLTLTGGSSFAVAPKATVTQSGDFKFVQGPASSKNPVINIAGIWSTSANLAIFSLPVTGNGAYSISSTGAWSFTNVNFQAASVDVKGVVQLSQGNFNSTTINGSGTFSGSPASFYCGEYTSSSFSLASGQVQINNGTVSTLTLSGGTFVISKTLTIGTLSFSAGTLRGPQSTQSKAIVSQTIVKGTTVTLTNIQLTTNTLALTCGASCQLFTNNAQINTA